MTEIINLVVVGAGLVGLRHINAISQQAGVTLDYGIGSSLF
ncbi:MAG: hypothetical protein ACKVKR_11140 [Pseudomonadales bacterium]